MPSENKTPNYGLNQWQGNEYPKRVDFNEDNAIIDEALTPSADPSQAPTGNGPGKLSSWVSWFANRIKTITGKTNWWEAPVKTLQEIWDDLAAHQADYATFKNNTNAEIVEIKKKIGIEHNIESWAEVQRIVRAGIADQVFKVGDMLVSKYNGEEVIWTIIGIDHDTPTNTEYIHSLTIQTRDCLANIQFDAPEPTNPDTNRQQYGNNRYIHSAVRQWLNSNDDVFQWVSQHEYDAAPTGAIYEGPGFLKLLDPELAAVIGAVDKQVARNTVTDGGGQDLFSDKVFLLSRAEVYGGTEGDTTGEEPYAYYSALAGAPTNGPLAGRIKLLNGSPRDWWLRSPNIGNSNNAHSVRTTGYVSHVNAYVAYGLSPACCII